MNRSLYATPPCGRRSPRPAPHRPCPSTDARERGADGRLPCGSGQGGCSPFRLRLGRDVIAAGGVLAYPTEAVYGLGCLPRDREALRKVLRIKGRSADKGLILVAASFEQVMRHALPLDERRMRAVRASWPGPVTWILPAREGLDPLITGNRDTVAVRVTAHPVAAALCRAVGDALVSTSANRSARPPARTPLAVRRALGRLVDGVLPGRLGGDSAPSTIRDAASGRILRG